MSNNVATNTKNEGRCSFSRKALSVATAAVLATTMVPMLPAESAWAAHAQGDFTIVPESASLTYSDGSSIKATISLKNEDLDADGYSAYLVKDGVLVNGSAIPLTDDKSGDNAYSQELVFDSSKNYTGAGNYQILVNANSASFPTDSSLGNAAVVTVYTLDQAEANKAWQLIDVTVNADKDADGDYYFSETASPVDFDVVSVFDKVNNKALNLDQYEVKYRGTGTTVFAESTTAPTAEGTYEMVVYPKGDIATGNGTYANVTVGKAIPFMIGDDAAVESMSLFQIQSGDTELAKTGDTDFYWTGDQFNALSSAGIVADGVAKKLYKAGESYAQGSYYIKTVNGTDASSFSSATGVGTYRLGIAKASSADSTGDQVLCYLDLEVKPFDLSKATFAIADVKAGNNIAVSGNVTLKIGEDVLDADVYDNAGNLVGATADGTTQLASASVTAYEPAKGLPNPGVSGKFDALGKYTVKVAAHKDSKSVVGETSTTVNVVDALDNDFQYAGKSFASAKNTFDSALGEAFDPAKVTNDSLESGDFDVTVYDADGNVTEDWSKPGSYTAIAQVKVDGKFAKGGSATLSFTVINGGDFSTVFSVDGEIVADGGQANPTYDGAPVDLFSDVKLLKNGKVVKTLAEGTDYTVEIKKDGKAVDEIKDAGTYQVKIVSDTYTFGSKQFDCTVEVQPRTVSDLQVEQGEYEVYQADGKGGVEHGILWTGNAIAPVMKYKSSSASTADYDTVLPADAYTTTYQKLTNAEEVEIEFANGGFSVTKGTAKWETVAAEDVKDAGFYKMTVSDVTSEKNYSVKTGSAEYIFQVVKTVSFTDVSSDAWYAPEIAKAVENGYIYGLAGTTLFMPNADITRGDTSVILYRMATGVTNAGEGSGVTYPSVFDDVKGNEYYAAAINWATKAGVVSGYDGTELFGPNDNASREQIATMLYRYMKAIGKDVTVKDEAAALAKYADGASVSEYAKTAMAYCVEQGIFGVDVDTLRPQDNMTRAEMAATAVRVQPEKLA